MAIKKKVKLKGNSGYMAKAYTIDKDYFKEKSPQEYKEIRDEDFIEASDVKVPDEGEYRLPDEVRLAAEEAEMSAIKGKVTMTDYMKMSPDEKKEYSEVQEKRRRKIKKGSTEVELLRTLHNKGADE